MENSTTQPDDEKYYGFHLHLLALVTDNFPRRNLLADKARLFVVACNTSFFWSGPDTLQHVPSDRSLLAVFVS
jgi:hypothetical protein